MAYQKRIIDNIENCYALAKMKWNGEQVLMVAGEKKAPCRIYSTEGKILSQVWDSPGGVMTMVAVPNNNDGIFLATQEFFSPDESENAKLVCAVYSEDGWKINKIASLPWVHRFDIIPVNNINYVIACTLKSGHEYSGDFRKSGKIYVGVLSENPSEPIELSVIKEGLTRNHGYTRFEKEGIIHGVISCDEGVYFVTPPREDESWKFEQLLDIAVSDCFMIDLDNDGLEELLTISPFHGDKICIWHMSENGKYEQVYRHPENMPFLHAIIGGNIKGTPMIFVGNREGKRQLLGFYYDKVNRKYKYDIIDENTGVANALLYYEEGEPHLLTSNREINEVAIYDFIV